MMMHQPTHPSYSQMQEALVNKMKHAQERSSDSTSQSDSYSSSSYTTGSSDDSNDNYSDSDSDYNYSDDTGDSDDSSSSYSSATQPSYSSSSYSTPSSSSYSNNGSSSYTTVTPSSSTQYTSSQASTSSSWVQQLSVTVYGSSQSSMYGSQQATLSMHGPFSTTNLQNGISLNVTIYPPSTNSQQQYLVVCFLKTATGSVVGQSIKQLSFTSPPTTLSIDYGGQNLAQKTVFTPNQNLSSSQNTKLFNSKSPVSLKFVLQTISGSIVVS